MYPVSDKYIAACRAVFKEERITGGIKLKDGTIISVDDSVIVQGSLSISAKACGSFDIGTANCSQLMIKIRDKSAYDHEFGGALIKLTYGIVVETAEDGTKTWEEVPLPPFFVGSFSEEGSCTRKRDMVTLRAYDTMSLLDINYPDTIPTTSLWTALNYVCNRAGVGLGMSEEDFNTFPNSDVIPDFTSESVQSCRDVVMWIAQTVGCCAFCDYRGLLKLKAYKYEGGGNYDRLFTANERTTIEYSDTRTYLAYLQSYVGNDVKQYNKVTAWTGTDAPHIKEGVLALPKNPILQKLTESQQEAINQSYFTNRSYPTRYIKATCFVDPALELLDVVAFSGGNIDVGQIINVATQIKWKYRGKGTIVCASVNESSETASGTSAASIVAYSADVPSVQADEPEIIRVQPKSQMQKELDELRACSGNTNRLNDINGSAIYAELSESTLRVVNGEGKILLRISPDNGLSVGGYDLGGISLRKDYIGLATQNDLKVMIESLPESGATHFYILPPDGSGDRFCLTLITQSNYTNPGRGHTIMINDRTLTFGADGLYYNNKRLAFAGE